MYLQCVAFFAVAAFAGGGGLITLINDDAFEDVALAAFCGVIAAFFGHSCKMLDRT